MRRLIAVVSVGALLIASQAIAAPVATGDYFSIPASDMASMVLMGSTYAGASVSGQTVVNPLYFTLDYDLDTTQTVGMDDGFGKIQYGLDLWPSQGVPSALESAYRDLSAFDEYKLSFHNVDDERLLVNLFMNTGWTDPGEPDTYYESTWTWLEPGELQVLTLDMSGFGYTNHVTALGVNFGANDPEYDSWGGNEEGTLGLDTVPEPATMLLLGGTLLGGLGAWRRKRRSA